MFHFDSNIYIAKNNTMSEISVASDFDKVAQTAIYYLNYHYM